ncbi:MAG: PQQ-binding-like beta-propeller repeat protein [Acidobacteriota bacterium]
MNPSRVYDRTPSGSASGRAAEGTSRGALWSALLMLALLLPVLPALSSSSSLEAEWTTWRGPNQNGYLDVDGLVDAWSLNGAQQLWRDDFVGRSTPVVFQERVCASGRRGDGRTRQAVVACWNADSGEKLWENRYTVFHTTVPFNRVGWGSVAADSETDTVFHFMVDGQLRALSGADGSVLWERRLHEEFGRFSGYGGRTNSPIVYGDQLILPLIGSSWGPQGRPSDRLFSFDKRTGAVNWTSSPGGRPYDLNVYSVPVVAESGDRRVVVWGNADGHIYALDAHTGEKLWGFELSKRGINSSVVVADGKVYASHGEENVDEAAQGRLVALDLATGEEVWRHSVIAGYASPGYRDGRLYIADNSANLKVFNAENGEELWEINYGTVGRGSPVLVDDKIVITEVNGNILVLEDGAEGSKKLSEVHIDMPGESGRYAEIYGSPAVAYQRIYFTTEEGIYCIGDPGTAFSSDEGDALSGLALAPAPAAPEGAAVATVQVRPAELVISESTSHQLEAIGYDSLGRSLGPVEATWSIAGLPGSLNAEQGTGTELALGKVNQGAVGQVVATVGEVQGATRVRAGGALPWTENFDDLEAGGNRPWWLGKAKFEVRVAEDGNVFLAKPPSNLGIHRHNLYLGPPLYSGYTVQADQYATKLRRRKPDLGLVNAGYTLDLQGNHQRIQLRSWGAELRMAETVDFPWEVETWYTLKLRVDVEGEKTRIRAKVWKRDEAEPEAWTAETVDELPVVGGSPGLYGYSPLDVYYDNVSVTAND